jgi:hypothetical protein
MVAHFLFWFSLLVISLAACGLCLFYVPHERDRRSGVSTAALLVCAFDYIDELLKSTLFRSKEVPYYELLDTFVYKSYLAAAVTSEWPFSRLNTPYYFSHIYFTLV